jgi:hypothetical protein
MRLLPLFLFLLFFSVSSIKLVIDSQHSGVHSRQRKKQERQLASKAAKCSLNKP